jgi:hypothetical protein
LGWLVISGVFFLTEWQAEQVQWNLLSEEDQAMTKLAENLEKQVKLIALNCHKFLR